MRSDKLKKKKKNQTGPEILSTLNRGTPQIGPSSSRKTWGLEVLLDSHRIEFNKEIE